MTSAFTPPSVDTFGDTRLIVDAQFLFIDTTFTQDNQQLHRLTFEGDVQNFSFEDAPVILQLGPLPRGYLGRQPDVGGLDIANPAARRVDKATQGEVNYSGDPMPEMVGPTVLKKI